MSGVMSVGDDTRSTWLNRVLGFSLPAAPAPTLSVRFGAAPPVSGSTAPPPLLGSSRGRASATPVKPALGLARPQTINAGGGRELEIRKGRDGRVAFKAPSPPVGEITFSGGGGKGAALPGAVDELQDTLKDVKVVKGASVGSMTAALVAAGISKEDFKSAANDPQTTKRILEGRMGGKSALVKGLGGVQVSGTGMQSVIREQMSKAASKQIDALLARIDKEHDESLERGEDDSASESSDDTGGPSPARASAIDPALLVEIKKIREKIKDPNVGLTFKDLRTLSQAIPEIKEVEISASMVGDIIETAPNGTAPPPGKKKDPKMSAEKPQLAMFNADTQPDMEVALAARASAALPPVFAPVEIELAQGFKGKFIDGGVLNNAPNAKSIQSERDVDPMPPTSAMTFIFEDPDGEDRDILAGKAKPVSKSSADKLTGAPHSAAEYARVRSLADNPEDVVVVPLTFKNAKGKKKDFSTLLGGTVNFDISDKNKKVLQKMTADATAAHIEKSRQPKTREFDSDGQMFMCLSTSDSGGSREEWLRGRQGSGDVPCRGARSHCRPHQGTIDGRRFRQDQAGDRPARQAGGGCGHRP